MQKRKKNTLKKTDSEPLPHFFDYIDAIERDIVANVVGPMIEPMMNSTLELTKLIIENKVRNNEKIEDAAIYEIHKKSFNHCMNDILQQEV